MAFPRRARRLWAYWRAEQRTLRQGFVALLLGTVAALVAGVALASITHTLQELPGLFILIPAAIGMRGTVFGAIGARLGTSTHAGLFEVTRERTGVLYQNAYVGIVLTLSASLYLALLAKGSAAIFGLDSIDLLDLVTISVVGGALDSAVILCVTIGLSVLSYRRGYDLDAVATPLITAVADMITIPMLFVATFLVRVHWLSTGIAVVAIFVCIEAAYRGLTSDLPLARRAIVEMVGVVLLTPLLDILAGTVLETRLSRFETFPGLLVLVPPFVANAGAIGGVLSSRLSSKLQLGLITPRGMPEPPALLDGSLSVGFGVFAFASIGALGLGYSALAGAAHPGPDVMVWGTLLAGMVATALAIVVAYYVAVATARFGLDPDNHGVPIITSVMDLAGVAALLFVLSLFGVSAHG
ncbi:MAG TPA: magnesium transporter [Actinomycetota bacterium]|nr:magnesium transporter [Actinomycetota bacterium]